MNIYTYIYAILNPRIADMYMYTSLSIKNSCIMNIPKLMITNTDMNIINPHLSHFLNHYHVSESSEMFNQYLSERREEYKEQHT